MHMVKKEKKGTIQIDMWFKVSLLFTPVPQPHFSGTTTSFWYLQLLVDVCTYVGV